MNTRTRLLLIPALWLGSLLPTTAPAQQENPPQAPPEDSNDMPKRSAMPRAGAAELDTPEGEKKPASKVADARRLMGQLRKLQAAMHSRLNLRRSQQSAIDNLTHQEYLILFYFLQIHLRADRKLLVS